MDIPTFSSILSCNHSLFQYTQFPHLWQEQKHSIGCNRPQNITGGCNHLSLSFQFILSHLIVKSFHISARQTIQQPYLSQPLCNFIFAHHRQNTGTKNWKLFHVNHFQFFNIPLSIFSALPQIIFHYFIWKLRSRLYYWMINIRG